VVEKEVNMSATPQIKLLFSPIKINKLQLTNRVIFAPMHNNLNAPDGSENGDVGSETT